MFDFKKMASELGFFKIMNSIIDVRSLRGAPAREPSGEKFQLEHVDTT
jgi:hypothetical protein